MCRFSLSKNRSGNAAWCVSSTCAPTFSPTSSSSSNGVIGRPNGRAASSTTSNGVPVSTACIASPSTLASTRLTTKPGVSRVMTAFLRSFSAVTIAVESASSVVFGVFTTSMSGMTATGLKKWKPTTRSGCSSFAPICSTESDEVFVARMVSGEMYCSTSAKTFCFASSSSKIASITQSQSAKSALFVVPVISAVRRFASSGEMRPFACSVGDLVVDPGDALIHAALVEVGDDDGHLQAPHEQQRELAGHEAGADHADLGDRARDRLVRRPGGTLGALLHEVERVDARAELVARDQVGERVILEREALLPVDRLGGLEQLERPVRRLGDLADAALEHLAWRCRSRRPT